MKLAIVLIALGVVVYGLYTNASPVNYQCAECGNWFKISFLATFFCVQRSHRKYLKCPQCGLFSWTKSDDKKENSLFRRLKW